MHRSSLTCLLAVVTAALAGAGTAWAQGYGVYEQSPCAMGRGGASVASPCPDGSAIFFNPAGLSFTSTQISLGGTLIAPRGTFTDSTTGHVDTLNEHWYPVPNMYLSTSFFKRVAVGLGLFAPYGLTTDWPVDSEGRYLGYHSVVQGIYFQPTVAIRITDRFSIGGGVDVTYLNVQLRQRVDLSTQPLPAIPGLPAGATFALLGVKPGSDFANLNLKGHAFDAGYHLGVLLKASKTVSFGARYLSGQNVEINNGFISTTQISTPYVLPISIPGVAPAGTPLDVLLAPKFAPGQPLGPQKATTSIPLPSQIVAGTAWQATPRLKLLADYQFTHWAMFDKLPVNGTYLQSTVVEDYKDTHGLRIGTEIGFGEKNTLRAGFDVHTAGAPPQTVTPNLPEGWRHEYSVGFGRQFFKWVRLDAAYLRLQQPDRAGRSTNGGKAVPTTADNNGVYSFSANLLSASMTFSF